jgi:hypothetical protein
MQRDILFFIRGLPQKYHVSGKRFFMADDEGGMCKLLAKIGETVPEFKEFIVETTVSKLSVAGFRNDYENESDSVCDAWHRLEGILDGVSLPTRTFHTPSRRRCWRAAVAQVSNLLYRRFPIGRVLKTNHACRFERAAGWKPCDTADWKSALHECEISGLTEEQQCNVGSIFLIRQDGSPDAELKTYTDEIEKYLIVDQKWKPADAEWVRRRIDIGLDVMRIDRKF